jgi:MoaA/NifB/PqqE/SkfB family radical SAM enzyme
LRRQTTEAAADPEGMLASILGPRFAAYRRAFKDAEAGARPPAPLHLDIDVTTVCQLSCPMCPAGGAFESGFPGLGLSLDENLYQSVLREAQSLGIPSLRLGITGEPLLNPDIDRWAAEAGAAGFIDVSLITNGRLLSPEMSLRLVKAGLTRLMISVDAASSETYARVRPGGDFKALTENIEAFVAIRAALGSELPLLRLSFVNLDANRHETGAFRERFIETADWLVFQDHLDMAAETSGRAITPASGPKSPRPSSPSSPSSPSRSRCPDPLTRLAVHADGGLFPCCSDYGRLAPLGRLPADSLESVWRSPQAVSLSLDNDHRSCRRCLAASGLARDLAPFGPSSGEQSSGDQSSGNKSSGDLSSRNKSSGEASGEKSSGNKSSGRPSSRRAAPNPPDQRRATC